MTTNIQVLQDPRKPYLAKVTLLFPDRQFAIEFLSILNATTDTILRQKAIKRTTEYIAYLSDTLAKVTNMDHRLAITQALSEQEKSAMVAKAGSPFSADLFERPWVSSLPSSPRPTRVLAMYMFVGFLGGSFLAIVRFYLARRFGGWFGAKHRTKAAHSA
jgi:hypothetical protein